MFELDKTQSAIHRFGSVFVVFHLHSQEATVRDAAGKIIDHFDQTTESSVAIEVKLIRQRWMVRSVNG